MKAVAVLSGKLNSINLVELPEPDVGDVTNVRGVLGRVLRVGVDVTDNEINVAQYSAIPEGYN